MFVYIQGLWYVHKCQCTHMMLQWSIKICGIWHGIQQHVIKVKGKIIKISKMSHKLRKNALDEQCYIGMPNFNHVNVW